MRESVFMEDHLYKEQVYFLHADKYVENFIHFTEALWELFLRY